MTKKKKYTPSVVNIFFTFMIFAIIIEIGLIYMPEKKEISQPIVYHGETLEEALFYNQCDFYNFLLQANGYSQRCNVPEENK